MAERDCKLQVYLLVPLTLQVEIQDSGGLGIGVWSVHSYQVRALGDNGRT